MALLTRRLLRRRLSVLALAGSSALAAFSLPANATVVLPDALAEAGAGVTGPDGTATSQPDQGTFSAQASAGTLLDPGVTASAKVRANPEPSFTLTGSTMGVASSGLDKETAGASGSLQYYFEVTGPKSMPVLLTINGTGLIKGPQTTLNFMNVLFMPAAPDGTLDTAHARVLGSACLEAFCGSLNPGPMFKLGQALSLTTNQLYAIILAGNFGISAGQTETMTIDPMFTFDSDFFAANGLQLVLSPNVGNGGLAATPLPAAFPLFATALGAFGLLGRRKRKSRAG
jgi:hypothetical protein